MLHLFIINHIHSILIVIDVNYDVNCWILYVITRCIACLRVIDFVRLFYGISWAILFVLTTFIGRISFIRLVVLWCRGLRIFSLLLLRIFLIASRSFSLAHVLYHLLLHFLFISLEYSSSVMLLVSVSSHYLSSTNLSPSWDSAQH